MKFGTRTRKQFHGKTISIATVIAAAIRLQVGILIRVTVDHLVVTAISEIRIERRLTLDGERLCLLDRKVLKHTYLQTCIVVPTEHTTFNDVVGTFYLHTVVQRILQGQTIECPIVCQVVHIDTARLLKLDFRRSNHIFTVDNHLADSIFRISTHFATQIRIGGQLRNLQTLGDIVCTFMYQDTVSCLHQLQGFSDCCQRSGFCSCIFITTCCSNMDVVCHCRHAQSTKANESKHFLK